MQVLNLYCAFVQEVTAVVSTYIVIRMCVYGFYMVIWNFSIQETVYIQQFILY